MIERRLPEPSFPLALPPRTPGSRWPRRAAQGLRLRARCARMRRAVERAVEAGHGDADMAATIHASR